MRAHHRSGSRLLLLLHVCKQLIDEGQQLPAQQYARSVRVAESIQDVLEQITLLDVLPRQEVRAFLSLIDKA